MDSPAPDANPVTIYDVAKAAGVAPSTVSRAFARPGRVSAETAQRIRDVAAELGYRVNPVARALSTSHSQMLTMVVPDIANPTFTTILRGAQLEAAKNGYLLLLEDTQESARVERSALERVLPVVDGVLLSGSRMSDAAIRMIAKQTPVVAVNRHVRGAPSVVTDNARGGRRIVELLGSLDHRGITYVEGPEASWANGARQRAVREAGVELSVAISSVGPYEPSLAGGAAAARDMLADLPTAAIAYNDLMAIGLIRGLQAAGVSVPQDVSVAGFDDIFSARLVTPSLTTVAAPLLDLGRVAVQALVGMIRGHSPNVEAPFVLPVRLMERDSTAHPRRKRISPALGTTKVSGSAASASRSTAAGSR